MLIKFRNNTFLEKPMGSNLVGLRRGGFRPFSIELDYFDFEKLLAYPHYDKYLVLLWRALAPDKRIQFNFQLDEGKQNAK